MKKSKRRILYFMILGILITCLNVYSQVPNSGDPSSTHPPPSSLRMPNAFTAYVDPNETVTFNNPVITGNSSDPSVCRVGEDYYLVTSSFRYFPGVPVYHSRDLVNWELIGYCIDRVTQIPQGLHIFACTIRYHKGAFYMITTNTGAGGNFFITANNPAGPWSDPVWIEARGIDPDLFFDDDGKAYVISSTFELYEMDLKTGKFLSEGRKIFNGNGGRYAEAPHIYKKDGFYYLMDAEGGTEEAHSVTIVRSKSIWGPYNPNPANPILTHCNAAGQGNPIQGVGHADIIQAHDGSWWTVFHGYRTIVDRGIHHILGRETCLAPVTWPKHGWPVVNGNGTVTIDMTCPTLPLNPFPGKPARVDFDTDKLGLEWNYISNPDLTKYSLSAREGYLRLTCSEHTIEEGHSPVCVGRLLKDMYFTVSTQLEFTPKADEEAGLIINAGITHFDLLIKQSGGKRVLVCRLRFGRTIYESEEIVLKTGPVKLRIKGERSTLSFQYSQRNEPYRELEKADAKFLSREVADAWMTYVGLYATSNGKKSSTVADYDWFEYAGNETAM